MKILFIAPHLSTGGMPQYLLKKIQSLKKSHEIHVAEWKNISGNEFVVQKNKIKQECHLTEINEDKDKLLRKIKELSPEIIHFEEIPETFLPSEILDVIYENKRGYSIVCTTHSSEIDPTKLIYTADKYVLVSEWSKDVFQSAFPSIPCDIWEYPIETKLAIDKDAAKRKLGFDPDFKHVLNVGLFTPGKNQGELLRLARSLKSYNIIFHFVGNKADNFRGYWGGLEWCSNCIWHGEKSNVEDFYSAADLFYFPSILELNPLALKEALSFNLPVLAKKLPTYKDSYDGLIRPINGDLIHDKNLLLSTLGVKEVLPKLLGSHLLINPNSSIEKESIKSLSKLGKFIPIKQRINTKYEKEDWKNKKPLDGWKKHEARHYGNFDSIKKAVLEDFSFDCDGFLIFESDCVLNVECEEFYSLVCKALEFCDKHEIPYFSFGPRFVDDVLQSPALKSDAEYPEFIITDKIIETHCILLTNHGKQTLIKALGESWDSPDIWFNRIFAKKGITISETASQLKTPPEISVKEEHKMSLFVSCGRRFELLERTINSLMLHNPDIKTLINKTWVLDDRSTLEDRIKTEFLFKKWFGSDFNFIQFNGDKPFDFVDKYNFIGDNTRDGELVFLLEDDWECCAPIDFVFHAEYLRNSLNTQISFCDSIHLQEKQIQEHYSVGKQYWKNPWPNSYRHIFDKRGGIVEWMTVKMLHYTNNPSIIKSDIFRKNKFQKIKSFESTFADSSVDNNHLMTNNPFFYHIGNNKSLIDHV